MEERYSLVRQRSGVWMSLRDGDFEEEEVWAVLEDTASFSGKSNDYSAEVPVSRPLPISAKRIPRTSNSSNSGNSSLEDEKNFQQSAPVSIPRWSYRNKSKKIQKKVSEISNDVDHELEGEDDGRDDWEGEEDEDDEDFNSFKVPPHEFLARRLARSQISSSVFEGVGRTLKGRDLSQVRNAVLTRTGFLESL